MTNVDEIYNEILNTIVRAVDSNCFHEMINFKSKIWITKNIIESRENSNIYSGLVKIKPISSSLNNTNYAKDIIV